MSSAFRKGKPKALSCVISAKVELTPRGVLSIVLY